MAPDATVASDPFAARARRRWLLGRIAVYGTLALFAAIYLGPALIVLFNSFRTSADVAQHGVIAFPERLTLTPWIRAWSEICVSGVCKGIAPNFWNSVVITVLPTVVSTLFGLVNGYILAHWRFRGDAWIFGLIVAGIFLPGQITLLPWAWIMGQLGLANSVTGLILIHTVQGLSFATLFARSYFVQVPHQMVQAAMVDGAGFWRIFRRVMLPLAPPIIIVIVVWQFTSIWNEYLFGMVFTRGDQQPVTAALMSARAGSSSAATLIAALPPILVYFLGGRFFVRGLMYGAMK